jgi:drug/metabolite transporter (DMT)-like permease
VVEAASDRRRGRRGGLDPVAAMVLATLLWGATFVIVRDALTRVSPVALVAVRFAAAAIVLGAIAALRRRPLDRHTLIGGVFTGTLTAGGYLFQAIGLTATSAGTSAFLTCAGTLAAGVFAWPLLGERPNATLAIGLLMAAAGSALLSLRGGFAIGPGEAWTLAGAVIYALQIVAVARWAPRADPVVLTGLQAATTAAVLLPFAGSPARVFAAFDPADALRVAYLVLAGSVTAPLLQVLAQRTLPAARIGLLFALEPVFALVFAITVGGERFVPRWWLGAALIVVAVLLVEWRASRGATLPPATSGTG